MLRSVRFWLGLGVSLVFIALFFRQADFGNVVDALRGANYWWFLPAVCLYLASLWVRALRYHFLVKDLGDIPTRKLFPVLCIAFMANNLVPARAGEVVRAYVMREKFGVGMMSAFGTIVVERLCDGLTLLFFLLATVAVLGANSTLRGLAVASVVVFIAALCVFGALLKWPGRSEAFLHRLIDQLPFRVRPLLRDLITSLLGGMVALRDPKALLAVAICSPLSWFMEAGVFLLVGRSFGIQLNIGWFMMAMAAGNLALTVPSSQGGIGPFEFFAKQVLVYAKIGEGIAAAYVLAVHAMVIIPVTLLGLIFLSVFNVSLTRAMHGSAGSIDEPSGEVLTVR
ncbi:MAG: lysylphosphatidylglycerol synthase transmembrane domain-containing protein [Dehalococcoidia bacterium]